MLKKNFSRTTRPISTKLGRKDAWGIRIHICSNKGAGPFWGLIRGKVRENLINLNNLLLMNHWLKWIDIGFETSLGKGDSNLFK